MCLWKRCAIPLFSSKQAVDKMVSFASPYPLAIVFIRSSVKSFICTWIIWVGEFLFACLVFMRPISITLQLGWGARFPAVAPRGSRTDAEQWHGAHISQACGRWIQDSASLWRAVPTALGWMLNWQDGLAKKQCLEEEWSAVLGTAC